MKKLIPAYVLAFVISFMFFIYEPLFMYANNIEDFWFDLYIIIKPCLGIFSISLLGFSFIFTLIYFINLKFSKKLYVYYGLLALTFIGFLYLYIQGNYLLKDLPNLDGGEIRWRGYTKQNIISLIILGIICISSVISVIKFKLKNVVKVEMFITLAVFGMLMSSFVSTLLTTDALKKKEGIITTTWDGINTTSSNKNFMILLVDATDSVMFEDVVKNSEKYSDTFKDFTYYKDTISAYPYTRDSIPFILSGTWNENETAFGEYYNKALNESKFFERLDNEKYDINLFDHELSWNDGRNRDVKNIKAATYISKKVLFDGEIRYIAFKYLPYYFKRYSKIENMEFKLNDEVEYDWKNYKVYDKIREKMSTQKNNYFQFLHVEGAHVPFDYDADLNYIYGGSTYENKMHSTLKFINTYLERLKNNNTYDNSVIIVMADHGFALGNGPVGRQNPILYIKGINEHHDMISSDIPVSYEDLGNAYNELLDGKKSTDLFKDIDKSRKRRFIWYEYGKENHMVEYYQTGKAWDEDTLKATGKEFNR